MDIRDLITLIIAFAIVGLIVYFVQSPLENAEIPDILSPPTTTPTPAPPPTPLPPAKPASLRIFYTSQFHHYPLHTLPAEMNIFGASDPPWRYTDAVVFGYLQESRGGISEIIYVPYPIWRITSTLEAEIHPESAMAQWVLVDADTGKVLEGGELRHPSVMKKTVHISNKDMYFIVNTYNADMITLTLETPRHMYEGHYE